MKRAFLILTFLTGLLLAASLGGCKKEDPFANDKEAPKISLTTPIADQEISLQDTVKLTGEVTDNEALSTAGWELLGTQMQGTFEVNGKSSSINESFPLSSTILEGTYKLRVFATDKAGNTGEEIVSIKIVKKGGTVIDSEAPSLSISKPAATGYEIAPGFKLPVEGVAKDNVGVSVVRLVVLNSSGEEIARDDIENLPESGKFSAYLNIISQTDGAECTLKVTAVDAAGNSTPVEIAFKVVNGGESPAGDEIAPTITIIKPKKDQTNEVVAQEDFDIELKAVDNVKVTTLKYTIAKKGETTVLQSGDLQFTLGAEVAITSTIKAPSGEGVYTLTFIAADEAGNEVKDEVDITVILPDTEAPQITLNSPANNAEFEQNGTVNITGSVTDNIKVKEVKIVVSGPETNPKEVLNETLSEEGVNVAINKTLTLSETETPAGTYTITITATDGKNSTDKTLKFTVKAAAPANTPPSVSITSPTANAEFNIGGKLNIKAKLTDDKGLKSMKLTLKKGNTEVFTDNKDDFNGATEFDYTKVVELNDYEAGDYELKIVCTDSNDESGEASVTFKVIADTEKPTVEISLPADGATFNKTNLDVLKVTGILKDNVKLASATISITKAGESDPAITQDISGVSGTEFSFEETVDYTALEAGSYQLSIKCKDDSNNEGVADQKLNIEE